MYRNVGNGKEIRNYYISRGLAYGIKELQRRICKLGSDDALEISTYDSYSGVGATILSEPYHKHVSSKLPERETRHVLRPRLPYYPPLFLTPS